MSALASIPTSVVPFRYAAEWETSSNGLNFDDDRTAAMAWLIERAYALDSIQSRTAAQNLAETLLREAEAEGHATVHADNEGGMGWVVIEAWQHAVTQGEADALAAHLASVLPVGTPVAAGDAMNRNVSYVGHVTAHTAESLVVAWVGGSTTEGKPVDMARILDVTDAPILARAQRDHDEAEAERITAAARQAVERADAERAARDADTAAYLAERADYVVTLAPAGDNRTEGLRRMTLAEATRTALTAEGIRRGARILPVASDAERAERDAEAEGYGLGLDTGVRVELAPHTDWWMQGARYGVVSRLDGDRVSVRLDRVARVQTMHRTWVRPVN